MFIFRKNIILFSIFYLALFGASFFVYAHGAGAQSASETETFHVDADFDSEERESVVATFRGEGERAIYYVEDAYWDSISSSAQSRMMERMEDLVDSFDSEIYPSVSDVFGEPLSSDAPENQKITILFIEMQENFGGYFREEDVNPSSSSNTSNNRPMFYINTNFLPDTRNLKAFVAHELQHLINHNQNSMQKGIREKVWLNEIMSEAAPSIAGLNDPYPRSNLQTRAKVFMNDPSVSVTLWDHRIEDYGAASMFGHYLLGHFGTKLYTQLIESQNTGIAAVNDALANIGFNQRFSDVFANWVVASLVNNCSVLPSNTFCYQDSGLNANNLSIDFTRDSDGGKAKKLSSEHSTSPWQGNWISYFRDIEESRPEDHYFVFTINTPTSAVFRVPYAVYPRDGLPEVFYLEFEGDTGTFSIEDFGYKYKEVVVMPIFEDLRNSRTSAEYSITAEVTSTAPLDAELGTAAAELDTELDDGALVRARGDDRVYIIKSDPSAYMGRGYKRWIQSAEVIDMYGHLRWDDVVTVRREVLEQYETVSLISMAGDERVFLLRPDGSTMWIPDAEDFLSRGFKFNMVYEINEREFGLYR